MILNKKIAICLSICLLVFNKQSIASVPADVDSKSLASALELASVVEKQVEVDKAAKEAVDKDAVAAKEEADKNSKEREDDKLAFENLNKLRQQEFLTYDQAKEYSYLFEKVKKYNDSIGNHSRYKNFSVLFDDAKYKDFVNNNKNIGKKYVIETGQIID